MRFDPVWYVSEGEAKRNRENREDVINPDEPGWYFFGNLILPYGPFPSEEKARTTFDEFKNIGGQISG